MAKTLDGVRGLAFDAFIARKLSLSYGEYRATVTGKARAAYEARYAKEFQRRRFKHYGEA